VQIEICLSSGFEDQNIQRCETIGKDEIFSKNGLGDLGIGTGNLEFGTWNLALEII